MIVRGLDRCRLNFATWINGHAISMLLHADAKTRQFCASRADTICLLEACGSNPSDSCRGRCKGRDNCEGLGSVGDVAHIYFNTLKILHTCDFDEILPFVYCASHLFKNGEKSDITLFGFARDSIDAN